MRSSKVTLPPPEPRLLGERNEFSFSMWIEMEGEPLLVHAPESVELGDKSLAWIAGQEGKNYTVHCVIKRKRNIPLQGQRYPDMYAGCYIDGVLVAAKVPSGQLMSREEGQHITFTGRRISKGKKQKLCFTKPETTENLTPDQDFDRIGRIEVIFKRCDRGPARTFQDDDAKKDWDKPSVGPMYYEHKKLALISSVTSFGEFQQSRASRVFEARVDHPSDKIEPFFKLALRYGKEEFLQALTKIALEINIPEGEPGWYSDDPIDVENEPEPKPKHPAPASDHASTPVPSSPIGDQFDNFGSQTSPCHGSSNISSQSTIAADRNSEEPQSAEVPQLSSQLDVDPVTEASYIASQIAELRAQIEELENPKITEPRGEKRSLPTDEEEDLKPDIAGLELMGKKLKYASAFDGGFVNLATGIEEATPLPTPQTTALTAMVLPQPPTEEEEDLKPDIAGLIAMGEKLLEAKKQDDAFVDLAAEGVATAESLLVPQPA